MRLVLDAITYLGRIAGAACMATCSVVVEFVHATLVSSERADAHLDGEVMC